MPQFDLFTPLPPALPTGFKYQRAIISPAEESRLLAAIRELPFQAFDFHGYTGRRRIVSFGHSYDFNHEKLERTAQIPPFLQDLARVAAHFAQIPAAALQHVLVTEYGPHAGIGWHRDKAVFGDIVGISLLSPCRFRLRRKNGDRWERAAVQAEPRSAYLLTGPARSEWEHSIPEVETLRYSVTYRTLR